MKTRLFSILMAAMLLLCACSSAGQNSEANLNETGDQETISQTGAANTVNTESTVNTVEPDGTTVTTEGSTEPATVPLVPDDTGYVHKPSQNILPSNTASRIHHKFPSPPDAPGKTPPASENYQTLYASGTKAATRNLIYSGDTDNQDMAHPRWYTPRQARPNPTSL